MTRKCVITRRLSPQILTGSISGCMPTRASGTGVKIDRNFCGLWGTLIQAQLTLYLQSITVLLERGGLPAVCKRLTIKRSGSSIAREGISTWTRADFLFSMLSMGRRRRAAHEREREVGMKKL
jgi:hypothetical protein